MRRYIRLIPTFFLLFFVPGVALAGQVKIVAVSVEHVAVTEDADSVAADVKKAPRAFYVEIVGTVNAVGGQMTATFNLAKSLKNTGLTQEQLQSVNHDLRFDSMAEAMNALASRGWKLEDTYSVTVRTSTSVYWIASKEVGDVKELTEGFAKKAK